MLSAGLGTRLRPLTDVRAKPAMPVAGQPLIRRIVSWLAEQGVTDVVVNLHHLPQTVTRVLGDGRDLRSRVRYSWEQPLVLGSAGGPKLAIPLLESDPFLIVNGDTLTDLDIGHLIDAHRASGALVTLALVPNLDPQRYGGVRLDEAGRVTGFAVRGESSGTFHFIGVQVASAEAFRDVPAGVPMDSIRGVYDAWLLERPGAIRGVIGAAAFQDIGTPSDYWTTSTTIARRERLSETTAGRDVSIDATARVTRSIIWDDVRVGPHAVLDECIVADGVHVPAHAAYARSIIIARPGTTEPLVSPLGV